MSTNLHWHIGSHLLLLLIISCSASALAQEKVGDRNASTVSSSKSIDPSSSKSIALNSEANHDIDVLKTQLANQQVQIEELKQALEQQKELINEVLAQFRGDREDIETLSGMLKGPMTLPWCT